MQSIGRKPGYNLRFPDTIKWWKKVDFRTFIVRDARPCLQVKTIGVAYVHT